MKVALFATCLVDTLTPSVARATASLLQRLGHEVVVPRGQSCCGQMHVNTGYRRGGGAVVGHHLPALAGAGGVVSPPRGCVAPIPPHQAPRGPPGGGRGLGPAPPGPGGG